MKQVMKQGTQIGWMTGNPDSVVTQEIQIEQYHRFNIDTGNLDQALGNAMKDPDWVMPPTTGPKKMQAE